MASTVSDSDQRVPFPGLKLLNQSSITTWRLPFKLSFPNQNRAASAADDQACVGFGEDCSTRRTSCRPASKEILHLITEMLPEPFDQWFRAQKFESLSPPAGEGSWVERHHLAMNRQS